MGEQPQQEEGGNRLGEDGGQGGAPDAHPRYRPQRRPGTLQQGGQGAGEGGGHPLKPLSPEDEDGIQDDVDH